MNTRKLQFANFYTCENLKVAGLLPPENEDSFFYHHVLPKDGKPTFYYAEDLAANEDAKGKNPSEFYKQQTRLVFAPTFAQLNDCVLFFARQMGYHLDFTRFENMYCYVTTTESLFLDLDAFENLNDTQCAAETLLFLIKKFPRKNG